MNTKIFCFPVIDSLVNARTLTVHVNLEVRQPKTRHYCACRWIHDDRRRTECGLECGGKRSATPLSPAVLRAAPSQSAVAAPLCRHSPKSSASSIQRVDQYASYWKNN